jgi:hypothetical protein
MILRIGKLASTKVFRERDLASVAAEKGWFTYLVGGISI